MATGTITDRFTAVPKTRDLIGAGVPAAAIPTYNALADHANWGLSIVGTISPARAIS